MVKKVDKKISTTFGERIGGSAKDKRGSLNLEDIKDMTERERLKEITKDKVWLKPNYEELELEGYDREVLYVLKQIRDRYPTKPSNARDESVELYILIANYLDREIKRSKELGEDVEGLLNRLNRLIWERVEPEFNVEETKRLLHAIKRCTEYKKILRYIHYAEIKEIKLEVELHNFPKDYKGVVKGLRVVRGSYKGVGGYYVIGSGGKLVRRECYDSYEDAVKNLKEVIVPKLEEEAKKKKEEAVKKAKDTKTLTERPQLKSIKRKGKSVRGGRDIKEEEFLKEFGFRGGEFGEWQNQKDRQACLNLGYEAFKDLGEVLGCSEEFISLGNYGGQRLAIAFGARGKGRALAHYEPAKAVINLTKMKGAGSLAHEWGHALDDYIGLQLGTAGMVTESVRGLSEEEELKDEIQKLLSEMKRVGSVKGEVLEGIKEKQKEPKSWLEWNLKRMLSRISRDEEEVQKRVESVLRGESDRLELLRGYIEEYKVRDEESYNTKIQGVTMQLGVIERQLDKLKLYEELEEEVKRAEKLEGDLEERLKLELKDVPTSWYKNAKILDKGAKNGYWSSNVEMFARLFESYVEDELDKRGYISNYLVHSTKGNGMLYPQGELREQLHKRLSKIVSLVVKRFDKGVKCEEKKEELLEEKREGGVNKERKEGYIEGVVSEYEYKEGIEGDTKIFCIYKGYNEELYKDAEGNYGVIQGGRLLTCIELEEGVYGIVGDKRGVIRPTKELGGLLEVLKPVEGEYKLKDTEKTEKFYKEYKGVILEEKRVKGELALLENEKGDVIYIIDTKNMELLKRERLLRECETVSGWSLKKGEDIEELKEEDVKEEEGEGLESKSGEELKEEEESKRIYKAIKEERVNIKCSGYIRSDVRNFRDYIEKYKAVEAYITEEDVKRIRVEKRYIYKDEDYKEIQENYKGIELGIKERISYEGGEIRGSVMLSNESGTSYILALKEGEEDLKYVGIGVKVTKNVELYKEDEYKEYSLEELKEYCEGLGVRVKIVKVPKSEDKYMLRVLNGGRIRYVRAESKGEGEDYRTIVRYITEEGYVKYYWGSKKGGKGVANELYKLIRRENMR